MTYRGQHGQLRIQARSFPSGLPPHSHLAEVSVNIDGIVNVFQGISFYIPTISHTSFRFAHRLRYVHDIGVSVSDTYADICKSWVLTLCHQAEVPKAGVSSRSKEEGHSASWCQLRPFYCTAGPCRQQSVVSVRVCLLFYFLFFICLYTHFFLRGLEASLQARTDWQRFSHFSALSKYVYKLQLGWKISTEPTSPFSASYPRLSRLRFTISTRPTSFFSRPPPPPFTIPLTTCNESPTPLL